MKKLAVLSVFIAVGAAYVFFDVGAWLTLEGLKTARLGFEQRLQQSPIEVAALFILFYALLTATSLPGAAILTLAGGALFGLVWGTVVVSIASVCGATLSFLMSRFLFHDAVQRRFAKRLARINEGVRRDGAFYLFTLRLVPLFPFFVVNPLMGLTPIRLWTYVWVSWIGMLPGTLVYVNAGTQLATIDSLSGIVSPPLMLSLALLGVFPLAAKSLLAVLQARQVYAGWSRPRRFDRNMVVIGAGAGGLVSAYIAATVRANVTLVESAKMGGDCLNYGCVPSKSLIASARRAAEVRDAGLFGITASPPDVDFRAVMQRIESIIHRIAPNDSAQRYAELGVDVIAGHATIENPWTVSIAGHDGSRRSLTTRAIVIAAGAAPIVPHWPGIESSGYLTSDTLWESMAARERPPARLVVVGGGPIGCELSQAFARLGSSVTLVQVSAQLLVREDADASQAVLEALRADGVSVHLSTRAVRCENTAGCKALVVEQDGQELQLVYDDLLLAVGRAARLEGYGLDALGISGTRSLATNEYLQTRYPNIFAVGDVTGPFQFTHAAAHQAWYASVNALFGHWKRFRVDYSVLPAVTYTEPEIARVGLNEREAQASDIAYELCRYELHELDRAICDGNDTGYLKVLTVPGKDRILGVTIVGAHAGELLAEFTLAMRHGLGLNKILGTIHPYPTLSESAKYVAGNWKRKHAPQTVLRWLERYHRWRR